MISEKLEFCGKWSSIKINGTVVLFYDRALPEVKDGLEHLEKMVTR